MAGTFNGHLHDFGSGNLSVSFQKQAAILEKGRQNAVDAARATGKPVVSADGKRLLALPPQPDPRDYVRGPGVAYVGGAPTRGPGAPGAGGGPSVGPGVPGVGVAPTVGPGAISTGVIRMGGLSIGGTGPGLGVVTPFVTKDVSLERTGVGLPVESLGAISDIGWARTTNGWVVVPSKDAKERMEDDIIQETQWQVRNVIGPYFGLSNGPTNPNWGNPDNYERDWLTLEYKPKPGTVQYIGGGF